MTILSSGMVTTALCMVFLLGLLSSMALTAAAAKSPQQHGFRGLSSSHIRQRGLQENRMGGLGDMDKDKDGMGGMGMKDEDEAGDGDESTRPEATQGGALAIATEATETHEGDVEPDEAPSSTTETGGGEDAGRLEANVTDVTIEEDGDDEDTDEGIEYSQLDEVCDPNPCVNGDCSRLSTPEGDDEADCSCYPGYVGTLCEISDPCLNDPCQNGGSCNSMRRNGDYSCDCGREFKGDHCEYVDPCFPDNPCRNGGICVIWLDVIEDGIPAVDCSCAEGYEGKHCERVVSS
jgi:hypothetical protein